MIRSQASDILKGATNVSECFDAERHVAFVTVGISPAVIAALNGFGAPPSADHPAPTQADKPAVGQSFERKSPNASLFQ